MQFSFVGKDHVDDAAPGRRCRVKWRNGSEIGAFSSLLNPIKMDDLKAKVNEFMPFGLIAQYINET